LPPKYREQALVELRRLARQVDLFIVHSQSYGLRMQAMLGFSDEQWAVNPLSIDTTDFLSLEVQRLGPLRPPTVGYLARLAPEKGLHLLVDAFIALHERPGMENARLEIAGWLGQQHESYWQEQLRKLHHAGLDNYCNYVGSVDRAGKMRFLEGLDVLCVPTTYLEPKGLFVLEALAAGVPYVQPAHGAFPELHSRLGGGHLFDPESPSELSQRLGEVLSNLPAARELGQLGRQAVFSSAATQHEAERFVQLIAPLIGSTKP
jgi:glycosyltransferase involved in cell wall biosynthesis